MVFFWDFCWVFLKFLMSFLEIVDGFSLRWLRGLLEVVDEFA